MELVTFISLYSETFLLLHLLDHLQGSHLVGTGRDSGAMLEEEDGKKLIYKEGVQMSNNDRC